ncbi:MAG: NAD+ synthase [Opitutales bacterium]|nr:NAD+ synthase [Opitutales bacterium]NRA26242.1 NAD+ synthase [Opitutales bacterium]
MRIGIAQINTIVGDLAGNCEKMTQAYLDLVAQGAAIVVFPELVTCGYPPRDLLFKSRFIQDVETYTAQFQQVVGDIPAAVGTVIRNRTKQGRPCHNAVLMMQNGTVINTTCKSLLPTYDVFDEDRYFEPGTENPIITLDGKRIGITICEDIWKHPDIPTSQRYQTDPVQRLADAKVDLIINCSASPWHLAKDRFRVDLVKDAAQKARASLVYCNAVGGNDELIFDGKSFVVDAQGKLLGSAPAFSEALTVIDTEEPSEDYGHVTAPDDMEDLLAALTLGLLDYAHKTGFSKALIGLSGGIDSALTAAIAARALGPENVIGISLPSSISSQHSRDDAAALAKNLGIEYHPVPITDLVKSATTALQPLFAGLEADVTEENIQARSRGLLLMAMSNKFRALLLTTGNKSELAVGYCTLYGDMCGGLAVISDVPKTIVFELSRHVNREREIIPWNTITKPPSAELRPDQKDEDSLPAYDILDAILERYVESGLSTEEIIADGYDTEVVKDVVRKVDLNEYKRKQAAPGLKVTPLAFGVGRRIPIVQKYVS